MTNLARRVLGDAAARAYANKLAAMTVSRRTFAIQDRAELSIAPGDQRQDRRGRIDRHHHRERSRRAVRVVHQERPFAPLQKDNVAGFLVSRTVFGGNANEYHSVLLLSSFADIDRGPAQAARSSGNGRESPAARGACRAHNPSLCAGSELSGKANIVGSPASFRSPCNQLGWLTCRRGGR
jgi:hypothetical protein